MPSKRENPKEQVRNEHEECVMCVECHHYGIHEIENAMEFALPIAFRPKDSVLCIPKVCHKETNGNDKPTHHEQDLAGCVALGTVAFNGGRTKYNAQAYPNTHRQEQNFASPIR